MRTPGTKRWSCDFVTGCFLPLPAVGRCNRQRVFFLSQLAPHGLTRQRDLVTMTPTLSLSLCIYIYINIYIQSLSIYIYIHACMHICTKLFPCIMISFTLLPRKNAFTICFQQYLLTKTRKKETPWHCPESVRDISLLLIVDVQKPSFAQLRLIVKCATTPWKIVFQDDPPFGPRYR